MPRTLEGEIEGAKARHDWITALNYRTNKRLKYGPSLSAAIKASQSYNDQRRAQGLGWMKQRKEDYFVGKGRYGRRRRAPKRRRARGRGKYSISKLGSDLSAFGRHLTTRRQRSQLGSMAMAMAPMALGAPMPMPSMYSGAGQSYASRGYAPAPPTPTPYFPMPSSRYGRTYDMDTDSYPSSGFRGRGAYYGGRGSYEAGNNVIQGHQSAGNVPQFSSAQDDQGDITISHTEYLGDIYGNPAGSLFTNSSYALNPGVERTFPWLSQIACNFAEYELVQCIFTYRSTASIDVDSNGQVGTVIMATNYNPDAADFTDKATMMQYAHANSDKAVITQKHGVECDPTMNAGPAIKYVRTSPLSNQSGDSVRYDQGTFQLAMHGTPTAYQDASIGELWISYTVRLNKPRLFSGIGKNISQDLFVSNGGETANTVFGTNSTMLTGSENSIGGSLNVSGANCTYTFPSNTHGHFEVMWHTEGNALDDAGITSVWTLAGEVTEVEDMYAWGSRLGVAADGDVSIFGDTGRMMGMHHIRVLPNNGNGNNTCTFGFSLAGGTITQSAITIREYNPTTSTPPEFKNISGYVTTPE